MKNKKDKKMSAANDKKKEEMDKLLENFDNLEEVSLDTESEDKKEVPLSEVEKGFEALAKLHVAKKNAEK